MKSNKVLLGLFAGLLALAGGAANAQNKFYEIGPANIGGQVSSLVVDAMDTEHTTLFAGATTGGIYVKSDNYVTLQALYQSRDMDASLSGNLDAWHYVPYYNGTQQDVLPVSCMVQGPAPDYYIFIGTGDDSYQVGSTYSKMSVKGKGVYWLSPETFTVDAIESTKNNANFEAVRALDYVYRNNVIYLFAATSKGLFLLKNVNDAWQAPVKVYDGGVDQVVAVPQLKMAYFSVGGKLFKISDVTAATINPIDLSNTNNAFGNPKSKLKIAVAPSDPSFLYVAVIDTIGTMKNVCLSRDMQSWNELATATVRPFIYTSGAYCGALTVDPGNPRHIFVAGDGVWSGTGYSDEGYYQWMNSSYSEYVLGTGNYMQDVYSNMLFVHSGIHQILPVFRPDPMGTNTLTYYIATDGGVYSTTQFNVYNNLNNGLNNVQVNGVAVAADGSIISGANNNACPFIESRSAHNGGAANATWYDNGSLGNLNHDANILWHGNGGQVAASAFQQLAPTSRRNIFVSSENGRFARTYADYFDYTNSQTWTIDSSFLTRDPTGGGPAIAQMYYWETDHDVLFNDSISFSVDTMGFIMRPRNNSYDTVWLALPGTTRAVRIERADNARDNDTIEVGNGRGASFRMLAGDKVNVINTGTAGYPFEYVYTTAQRADKVVRTKNPIQSRMLVIGRDVQNSAKWGVYMTWNAPDFTRVFDPDAMSAEMWDALIFWSPIFISNTSLNSQANFVPRTATLSEDASCAFVAVQDKKNNRSFIIRVSGFADVDYSANVLDVKNMLTTPTQAPQTSKLHLDTLYITPGDRFIPRIVSSLTVKGEQMVVTFEDYNEDFANVAIVDSIFGKMTLREVPITGKKGIPAFCSMVEKTTGKVYVGTAEGVSVLSNLGANGSWSTYENIMGVPVTSIVQQKFDLPVRRNIGHTGINRDDYVFAKTKWPNAIYFGTYGRGIFLDMQYVTDTINEVSDSSDWDNVGIPTVVSSELSSVSVSPNPVYGEANISLLSAVAGQARLVVYDLNGRMVVNRNLGHVNEGSQTITLSTEGMSKGMYLVNVIIGGHTAATKMMVR